jgi:hypothetical protein
MTTTEMRGWLTASRPPEDALVTRVRAALFHGWTPNLDLAEEDMVISDWLDDVGEFPTWTLTVAFRTWRRDQPNRRPSPGGIRALCMAEMRRLHDEIARREKLATPPEPEAPRANADAVRAILAGFTSRRAAE